MLQVHENEISLRIRSGATERLCHAQLRTLGERCWPLLPWQLVTFLVRRSHFQNHYQSETFCGKLSLMERNLVRGQSLKVEEAIIFGGIRHEESTTHGVCVATNYNYEYR